MSDRGPTETTMRSLLTAGNTRAVAMVNLFDRLEAGHEVDESHIRNTRDGLEAWARDVRAASSE